jgi:serine/threonine-protein kinase
VKVLDFGLARIVEPGGASAAGRVSGEFSQAPTLTTPAATRMGVIMGTAAYMSPEQAKGRPVDRRADIWAFACVLYEMLTGKRAFEGSDVSEVLAGVLKSEPDWEALPSTLSPSLRTYLRRSLHKDSRQRIRDIGDVRLAMEGVFETALHEPVAVGPGPQLRPWQRPVRAAAPALSVAVAATAATVLALRTLGRPAPAMLTRLVINPLPTAPLTSEGGIGGTIALSDGRTLIYVAGAGDVRRLYVRRLDELDASPLAGTEGAGYPFFSPDSQWVGFATTADLKKVRLAGGPPVTICKIPATLRSASWGEDGSILFGATESGLWRVSAAGGNAEPVTTPDAGELGHQRPDILPGARAALFTIWSGLLNATQIGVLSLETGERRSLLGGTTPHYVATGHIVFWQTGSLWAVPFDPDRLEITGEPVPVVEGVEARGPNSVAQFALSAEGTLAYLRGDEGGGRKTLVWVDREGREEPLPGLPAGDYQRARISGDGRHVAVDPGAGRARDVWTYDVARATMSRLTTDPADDALPLWTLDGQRIAFTSNRGGRRELFWQRADGTGQAERLFTPQEGKAGGVEVLADAWSPDGTKLLFTQVSPGADIGALSMEGEHKAELLIQTGFTENSSAISPNGRWLAYQSNLSGEFEIYVERFPELGERLKISTSGGTLPLWSPDGRELFYLSRDGRQLFAVPIAMDPRFSAGAPKVLFEGSYTPWAGPLYPYHLAPDGKRFLMMKPADAVTGDAAPQQIVVVQNWLEELKRLVPR